MEYFGEYGIFWIIKINRILWYISIFQIYTNITFFNPFIKFLQEFRRYLSPGGVLIVNLIDFARIVNQWKFVLEIKPFVVHFPGRCSARGQRLVFPNTKLQRWHCRWFVIGCDDLMIVKKKFVSSHGRK